MNLMSDKWFVDIDAMTMTHAYAIRAAKFKITED